MDFSKEYNARSAPEFLLQSTSCDPVVSYDPNQNVGLCKYTLTNGPNIGKECNQVTSFNYFNYCNEHLHILYRRKSVMLNQAEINYIDAIWNKDLVLLCKKCFKNNIHVLQYPCSHFFLCTDCSQNENICSICSIVIQKKLYIHISN